MGAGPSGPIPPSARRGYNLPMMKNRLIVSPVLVFGLLGSIRAPAASEQAVVGRPVPMSAGGASAYTAECWLNHIDYQGMEYDYPVCAPIGYSRSWRERNPGLAQAPEHQRWLGSIFHRSIDRASFSGTPLEAEVLRAVASEAVEGGAANREYVKGLFDLLRAAVVPQADPGRVRRRINAAVKERWMLLRAYGELCEKSFDLCYPGYFGDFYAVARHDWSPRTRRTALSLVYFLEPDGKARRGALEDMAARDGQAVFLGQKDGSYSYESRPDGRNKSFARYLLQAAPRRDQGTWAQFYQSLAWSDGSQSYRQEGWYTGRVR